MASTIKPVLLLPQHVKPTASNVPLLEAIQTVLNDGYTKSYCAHPTLFGSSHTRLADAAKFGEIIGDDGFAVILLQVSGSRCEVVATGSVKNFKEIDAQAYGQRTSILTGSNWPEEDVAVLGSGSVDASEDEAKGVKKFEITAFAVSPHHQAGGLGARVLKEIEWLVSSDGHGSRLRHALRQGAPSATGLELQGSGLPSPVVGIDLDRLREDQAITASKESAVNDEGAPKLVLISIRELGNEGYYQRRGFRSIWAGTVPVGLWHCKKECTIVYMEKDT